MGATISAKNETVKRDWYEVDATDEVLGRLASKLAFRLRGKHKPEFTTHVDTGDYFVVKNAAKVKVTGNKAKGKIYYSHSLHTGSLKEVPFEKLMAKDPTAALKKAIKGMLPKGPLGRDMFRKLKIYAGDEHPHAAQEPKFIKL